MERKLNNNNKNLKLIKRLKIGWYKDKWMLTFKIILIKTYNKTRIIIRIYLNKKKKKKSYDCEFYINWLNLEI